MLEKAYGELALSKTRKYTSGIKHSKKAEKWLKISFWSIFNVFDWWKYGQSKGNANEKPPFKFKRDGSRHVSQIRLHYFSWCFRYETHHSTACSVGVVLHIYTYIDFWIFDKTSTNVINQVPYSLDMCDFSLFPKLKLPLCESRFEFIEVIKENL